jgi:hypothetical protein
MTATTHHSPLQEQVFWRNSTSLYRFFLTQINVFSIVRRPIKIARQENSPANPRTARYFIVVGCMVLPISIFHFGSNSSLYLNGAWSLYLM